MRPKQELMIENTEEVYDAFNLLPALEQILLSNVNKPLGNKSDSYEFSETHDAIYELHMKLQRAKKMLKKCVYADTPEEDQAEKIKELEHILAEQEKIITQFKGDNPLSS